MVDVPHVDQAPPEFHDTLILEDPERPRDRLPVGPYHGSQPLVGVVGGYPVSRAIPRALALDQEHDDARQAGVDVLQGYVLEAGLVAPEPLAQQVRYLQAHLWLLQDQALQILPAHVEQN